MADEYAPSKLTVYFSILHTNVQKKRTSQWSSGSCMFLSVVMRRLILIIFKLESF